MLYEYENASYLRVCMINLHDDCPSCEGDVHDLLDAYIIPSLAFEIHHTYRLQPPLRCRIVAMQVRGVRLEAVFRYYVFRFAFHALSRNVRQ